MCDGGRRAWIGTQFRRENHPVDLLPRWRLCLFQFILQFLGSLLFRNAASGSPLLFHRLLACVQCSELDYHPVSLMDGVEISVISTAAGQFAPAPDFTFTTAIFTNLFPM